MFFQILLVFLVLLILYYIYEYKKLHYHFDKYGIKYKPGVPIFGNTFYSTLAMRHVLEDIDEVYKAFPEERYVGFLEGTRKVILVRDPELMKIITIRDSDHFVNRKVLFPKEIDPLLGRSIMSLQDEEWREMKGLLSPALVSAKVKHMVPAMVQISRDVVEYLKDYQSKDVYVFDVMARYVTDVTTVTIFGNSANSLQDCDNEFLQIGNARVAFDFSERFYYFFVIQFPAVAKLMEALGIPLFDKRSTELFRKVTADMIEYRKKNKVVRNDFIHLLTEALNDNDIKKNPKTKGWTIDDIAGQILAAFQASFESNPSITTMCLHELALNPECEERLYQEIRAHHEKEGELNYDNINDLKYLNCVLNETLRLWTTALYMDRVCSKAYTLPPPREGGKPYMVHRDDLIYNVVNSTHMNPEYHPEPTVFNPDRFSDENKHKIKSFTYMPFGMGPRRCIGLRYETLKMKVILYQLVLHYKIRRCSKTTPTIRLEPSEFFVNARGGTYVHFISRN